MIFHSSAVSRSGGSSNTESEKQYSEAPLSRPPRRSAKKTLALTKCGCLLPDRLFVLSEMCRPGDLVKPVVTSGNGFSIIFRIVRSRNRF